MTTPFFCPSCRGPLPPPAGGFVTCKFCGVTSSVEGNVVRPAPTGPVAGAAPSFEERTKKATATFSARLAAGEPPEHAAWYAAHDFASPDVDPKEICYGAVALAKEFDRENDTNVLRDATCMARLFEAWSKASISIRTTGRATVNLPFLTATGAGPLHLARELDATSAAALLASTAAR